MSINQETDVSSKITGEGSKDTKNVQNKLPTKRKYTLQSEKTKYKDFFASKIKISQAVQKHPVLYNTTLKEYGEKGATQAAWEVVAEEMGDPVINCKKMWDRVLINYSQSLKLKGSRIKSYYMTKHLEFLFPFLEPSERPVLDDSEQEGTNSSSCEDDTKVDEDDDDEDVNEDEKLWDDESRKQFLISYLPDVRQMSYSQMITFRQKVMSLVNSSLKDEI